MAEAIRASRWENQKAQAKREGFKNPWEMRKVRRKAYGDSIERRKPHAISEGLRSFSAELKDLHERKRRKRGDPPAGKHPWRNQKPGEQPEAGRFDHAPGALRQLMRDGEWLVPEDQRPQQVVVSPRWKPLYSQQTKAGVDSNRLDPRHRGES